MTTAPAPTAVPEAVEVEEGTRSRVLDLVATTGPTTAVALAEALALTPTAVRRHLGELLDTGLIAEHEHHGPAAPARRGRPARHYVVTGVGQDSLPQGYAEIAHQLLDYLVLTAGADGVRDFAEARAAGIAARYGAVVDAAGHDTGARAVALAAALTRDGYAASARPVGNVATLQLCQGNCPVRELAAEHPELCDAEAHVFSQLLGVHVQRLATLATGGHVCTTNIPLVPAGTVKTTSPREGATA